MSRSFSVRGGILHAEEVDLRVVAERFGTPCYVYSRGALEDRWRTFRDAFEGVDHLICYAVKANANLAVLDVLARLGSGFDIVSGGELQRVLAAGGAADRIVFSGVGKTREEIRAALEAGIGGFNVESTAELERIRQVAAELGQTAPVSLRINPDVDARTHPYIATGLKENKFGIPMAEAAALARRVSRLPGVRLEGLDFHIGSQLVSVAPFVAALDRLLVLVDALAAEGIGIRQLNVGGGLGVRYRDETPPSPTEYAAALRDRLAGRPVRVLLEPGRAIAAGAGVLLTRVEYLKPGPGRGFAIVDAGMNDLLRPALYDAWHEITTVAPAEAPAASWDVVGPVCETADFLGRERLLSLDEGTLVAVHSAGAYGFVMSSNYNARPRAAEVMVDGDTAYLVRERESVTQLWQGERCLPA